MQPDVGEIYEPLKFLS